MRILISALTVIAATVATALLMSAVRAGLEAVYDANSVDAFFIALPSVVIVTAATAFLASRPVKKRLGGRRTPPRYRLKFHQLLIPMLVALVLYPAGLWIIINFGFDGHWARTLLHYSGLTAGMTAGFCWWLADIEKAAAAGGVGENSSDIEK